VHRLPVPLHLRAVPVIQHEQLGGSTERSRQATTCRHAISWHVSHDYMRSTAIGPRIVKLRERRGLTQESQALRVPLLELLK